MKSLSLLSGLIFILLFSCKDDKEANEIRDYCYEDVTHVPGEIIIPEADYELATYLFEYNNIDYSNYQFYRVHDEPSGEHHIRCYQYRNNLKVFSNNLVFHFDENDAWYRTSGEIINEIPLDAEVRMSKKLVIQKFTEALLKDNSCHYTKEGIDTCCFKIELGYSGDFLPASEEIIFTRVWNVTIKHKEYVFAKINDNTTEVIGYYCLPYISYTDLLY